MKNKWYNFSTKTDTEIILASYLEYWENCVNYFNWMWSFIIYDKLNNKIFASRDRLGKKPFYYYFDWNEFIFSSEIKGILETWIDKKLSELWLNYYLMYWYIPWELSIFEWINKLQAWWNLIIDLNNFKLSKYKYYEIKNQEKNNLSFEENKKIIIEKLENAVETRLVSDVPVWSFLSWWIDSSLVSLITKEKFWQKDLHTFSLWFDKKWYDETPFAKIVADKICSIHHFKILTQSESFNILQKLPYYYDEPFADSSMIPTFAVSELARKYVTVSLSWDWADEFFWWYLNYILFYYLNNLNKVLLPWINHLANWFWKILSNILKPAINMKWAALWLKSLDFLKHNKDHELWAQISSNHAYIYKSWLDYFKRYFTSDWRDNVMLSLINTHLIDDFFVKVDRASMANSLEVRSPFVDKNLIEFALTIPSEQKIKIYDLYKYKLKYVLKEAWKWYLPNEIYNRGKQGFWLPVAEYFNNEWKWFLYEKLEKLKKRDILPISNKYLNEILDDHSKWKYDYFGFIYSLLFLELWFEEWMD